jgi:hypothetical protein
VGVTRQSLLNYMSGRFQPRYNTLAKLGLVKNADRSPNPTSQASA